MIPYERFAQFYDELTSDIDYEQRAEYFEQLFDRHRLRPKIVLDLACGTGSLSVELARRGYEVIGVDRSPEMLAVASGKAGNIQADVLFICQGMSELDLYGTVDAAICHLDGINHLSSADEVLSVFKKVSLFLNDGGLFIFDLNTPYKIENILGNNTFVYDYEGVYCVWQNSYRPKSGICRFDLTFFEPTGDHYRRYDEHFAEKAYDPAGVKGLLREAGLSVIAEYDDFTCKPVNEKSGRIVYVARKGNE